MSGIYGILGDADPAELEAMGRRLAHRGSERTRWEPAPRVHLGLGTLAREATPDTAVPVLLDGFLDNAEELAGMLGQPVTEPTERGDAAAVFAIYRRFGPDGFRHLSGHFAFALWDEEKGALVCGRDLYGGRPFNLARAGERWIFASEYKSILAIDDVPVRPNLDAMQYLQCTRFNRADESFLLDVHPVPPGHWVIVEGKGSRRDRFWSAKIDVADRSEREHADHVRETILDAARRQTERYDPVGVSLSGGLDSAVTVAAIRHTTPDKRLLTFSGGFGPEDQEIVDAAVVARHFDTEHHEVFLDPDEIPDILPSVVWFLEEPAGREETAFLYVTSREAVKHVEMLMAGYGADLLFGGMPRHRLVHTAFHLPLVRRPLEEFFTFTQAGLSPGSLAGKLLVKAYYRGRHYPFPELIGAEHTPEVSDLTPHGEQPLGEYLLRCLTKESVESKTERMHSCFGLSFNAPTMDPRMIDCAIRIPDRLKIRGRKQKYVLRRAFQGLLPDSVLQRKKTFQKLRHDVRFSDALERLAQEYLAPADVKSRGLFPPDYVEQLVRRPAGGAWSTEQAYRIWSVVVTEIWARLFLDRRGRPLESA